MVIYYAHAMADYGSDTELKSLILLRRLFPEATIINPATDTEAKRWKAEGMKYFDEILKDNPIDLVVFQGVMSTVRGFHGEFCLTAGVAYEVNKAVQMGVPVLQIPIPGVYVELTCKQTNQHIGREQYKVG